MGVWSEFGSSCSYSSDAVSGRSRGFPDSLVHGAPGTLAAIALRQARIHFAAFRFENTGAGNHYLRAGSDRRFLWSERVREVRGASGCSDTSILQRLWNISFVASGGAPSFRMVGRTSADNSLGPVDHQCLQLN